MQMIFVIVIQLRKLQPFKAGLQLITRSLKVMWFCVTPQKDNVVVMIYLGLVFDNSKKMAYYLHLLNCHKYVIYESLSVGNIIECTTGMLNRAVHLAPFVNVTMYQIILSILDDCLYRNLFNFIVYVLFLPVPSISLPSTIGITA